MLIVLPSVVYLVYSKKLRSVYVGEEKSKAAEDIHRKLSFPSPAPCTPVLMRQGNQTRHLGRSKDVCLKY